MYGPGKDTPQSRRYDGRIGRVRVVKQRCGYR